MTYNGSERKHIRQAEKLSKQVEARRHNFVRQIMLSMDGREWMHDLLAKCHVFHTPFAAGQPDVTGFRCGEQNLGLQIFADVVGTCPSEYVLMMQEANAKEVINDRRYSDQRSAEPAEPTGTEQGSGRDDQGPDDAADGDEAGSDGWVH